MKTNKIIYWIATALASLSFLLAGFMYLSKNPELMQSFSDLGFPEYFVMILGIAKLLGAIGLLLPKLKVLNEWAYAGLTFVLIGAAWTHIATSTPFIAPLISLAILATSYGFRYRINKTSAH